MRTFLSLALLLIALPHAHAADRQERLERKFVTLTVKVSGFPADTRFRVDARAVYRMIDPSRAPRDVKFAVTDEMVKYRLSALRDGVWESSTPADGRPLKQVFRFEFSERLLPPPAGAQLWARVSIPISFAYSDAATHLMRPSRPLGSIPIAIESNTSSLERCLALNAIPGDAVQFQILDACPD